VLIITLYRDASGVLQRRDDRGTNRRLLTLATEQDLPTASHILGVIVVDEGPRHDRGGDLKAV
jgi:hypothetical protein